ncbi:unnamed protein product [Gongylonema pulchrum]|uniref:GST N-terminal domain-containing protein n=1 Tax=Gongylonema pulchrum TaxID=637853 RepID=A0A183D6B5_9BILA|nr:unnamed protein product [Gongylonema pulchrum]
MKLVTGVDKGIRFIEGDSSTGGIVPALVLDTKKAPFFNEGRLMDFVAELYTSDSKASIPQLDAKEFQKFRRSVEPLIRNLRLVRMNSTKTFIASYLSNRPVSSIMYVLL